MDRYSYSVVVHVYATCLLSRRHGASGFTLLKNPPSILTFTWCYGAVKHLFLRRFLVPGGAVRHAQYRGKYTSQQATTGQCADDKRLEEKYDGEGDGEHMQPMQSTCNEWCSAS